MSETGQCVDCGTVFTGTGPLPLRCMDCTCCELNESDRGAGGFITITSAICVHKNIRVVCQECKRANEGE